MADQRQRGAGRRERAREPVQVTIESARGEVTFRRESRVSRRMGDVDSAAKRLLDAAKRSLLLMLFLALPGYAQDEHESDDRPSLSQSPNAVESQLESDAVQKAPWIETTWLDPVEGLKARLLESTGLRIGADYSTQYFHATDSLDDKNVAAGIFRIYGVWNLVGEQAGHPGGLVYKVEQRHRYTTRTPAQQSFDVGNVGAISPVFSNDEWRLTNLFWQQRIAENRFVLRAGFLDLSDYLDVYAMASPWLHFSNLAFSTGSSSIPVPGDATLGVMMGAWLTENFYFIAGLADANADPTDPFQDSFFDEHEYFTHAELGWTSAREKAYLDNIHVTFWHADERSKAVTNDGWGFNLSASWWFADAWMPFLRGGYAHEGGSLLEKSASVGIGYQPLTARDVLGLAFNWGEPNSDTFGPGLDDQYGVEFFWRIQLLNHLAITPSIEWLLDPALNPDESSVWLFGLRMRFEI
jgi:porin